MDNLEEYHLDAIKFALLLAKTELPDQISIGKFILQGSQGVKDVIQYNQSDFQLLGNIHEYTFPILQGELQVSVQLYENTSNHYRLFCYTKANKSVGMTFSLNLTTEKESDNVIFLTQKIKFAERYDGDDKRAQAHRRQKQIVFCDMLRNLGFEITENNDIILGIFDPQSEELVNTSPEKFLNDFIVVSIIKGHFQGNKGYQLEILPNFNKFDSINEVDDNDIDELPLKVIENKSKRSIPLSMRYKVFKKDNFKCIACGRSAKDDIKLHIDHKTPFSLGGLTELNNLQTLCEECNISKSNKFIDN